MKKIFMSVVSAVMIMTLSACGDDSSESSGKIIVNDSSSMIYPTDTSIVKDGNLLADKFVKMVEEKPDMTAQEAADAMASDPMLPFKAMTMPVENGLLTGFGNNEVKGFKEGVMFAPAIGSIPFIGYIFIIDDNTELTGFMSDLMSYADKRWNVCTEADSVVVDNVEKMVFFVMCPDKLDAE